MERTLHRRSDTFALGSIEANSLPVGRAKKWTITAANSIDKGAFHGVYSERFLDFTGDKQVELGCNLKISRSTCKGQAMFSLY
jgi:hypothetical protein